VKKNVFKNFPDIKIKPWSVKNEDISNFRIELDAKFDQRKYATL
jgi:hypothetical protein